MVLHVLFVRDVRVKGDEDLAMSTIYVYIIEGQLFSMKLGFLVISKLPL